MRSILPIRDPGGVTLADGRRVQVEPILVGRNEAKITELAERHKVGALEHRPRRGARRPGVDIVFDAR